MSVVISLRYQLEVSTRRWLCVCDLNQPHTHTRVSHLTQPAGGAHLVNLKRTELIKDGEGDVYAVLKSACFVP